MNKELVRKRIELLKGKRLKFVFNGSRNQKEKFHGTIVSIYPSVFLVETNNHIKELKSFSYNDVINSNLQICEK